MKAAFRLACAVLLPLALVACGKEESAEKGAAGGEILPGSASDAMLPLDTVRSQPPLAPPTANASGRKGDKADDEEPAADASGAADTGAAASEAAAPVPVVPPSKAATAPE